MSSPFHRTNLNDNMVEISKTLETLKHNRLVLEKDIENGDIYREKLIEKLQNYESEINRINGTHMI
jgi:hypothetical protein